MANSADTDEMPCSATFYMGLHCLPKYLLTDMLQSVKGLQCDNIASHKIANEICYKKNLGDLSFLVKLKNNVEKF